MKTDPSEGAIEVYWTQSMVIAAMIGRGVLLGDSYAGYLGRIPFVCYEINTRIHSQILTIGGILAMRRPGEL